MSVVLTESELRAGLRASRKTIERKRREARRIAPRRRLNVDLLAFLGINCVMWWAILSFLGWLS